MNFILQWIDVFWLLAALAVVRKEQRMLALSFIAACMVMMRLQAELMQSISYSRGILNIWDMPVFDRGVIVYSLFYAVYLVMMYYSREARGPVLMAVSISAFFAALFIFMIVMVL